MKKRNSANIIILSLALMAFLLRPYLSYQPPAEQQSNRGAAVNLLQRLVKKDDHHAVNSKELNAIQCEQAKLSSRPSFSLAKNSAVQRHIFPVNRTGSLARNLHPPAYYKLFAVFRI